MLGLHYCAGFPITAANRGCSPAAACRPLSSCSALASHCGGFSCCAAGALGLSGFSSCCSWGLGHKWNSCVKSCGPWIQLLCGMWNHPRPRIEPMSPSLEGRFFTTEPPGKPCGGFNIIIITLTIWRVIHQFFILWFFFSQCVPATIEDKNFIVFYRNSMTEFWCPWNISQGHLITW